MRVFKMCLAIVNGVTYVEMDKSAFSPSQTECTATVLAIHLLTVMEDVVALYAKTEPKLIRNASDNGHRLTTVP